MSISYPSDNIVIADANVLINFIQSGHFDVLLKAYERGLHITDVVNGEIRKNRALLENAIQSTQIYVHHIPIDRVAHLAKSFSNFHPGESSCLELAKEKQWRVATDDGAAKSHIESILGKLFIVTTFEIILKAVRLGVLQKAQAPTVLDDMEKKADFFYNEAEYKAFVAQLKKL